VLKHIHEPILGEEQEYVCLLCETQFFHKETTQPVCPNCGAAEPDKVVLISELEEEEERK